jgi:hypothetical protein
MRPMGIHCEGVAVFRAFSLVNCMVTARFLNPFRPCAKVGHRTRDYANR